MRSQLTCFKALIDAILTITTAQVDGMNTLPPGNPASVSLSVVGNTLHFTFDIPQGGVTNADMNNAIANAISGTSNNTNGVSTLDTGFADPDMEALRQKVNEMILNGRR